MRSILLELTSITRIALPLVTFIHWILVAPWFHLGTNHERRWSPWYYSPLVHDEPVCSERCSGLLSGGWAWRAWRGCDDRLTFFLSIWICQLSKAPCSFHLFYYFFYFSFFGLSKKYVRIIAVTDHQSGWKRKSLFCQKRSPVLKSIYHLIASVLLDGNGWRWWNV